MASERRSLPVKNTSQLGWLPGTLRLAVVSADRGDSTRELALFDLGQPGEDPVRRVIPSSTEGALNAVAGLADPPRLLLAFEGELRVWDHDAHLPVQSYQPSRPVRKAGLYPDGRRAWALVAAESDSVDWAEWDFERDRYREFPLERCDHCGRGAALHPSGLLLGACWNAYECGYLLHEVAGEQMLYYTRPSGQRPEYEAYGPAFSPDGRLFAFLCNRYQANTDVGVVCVFDVQTGKQVAAFSSGGWLNEVGLQFTAGGREVAFALGPELKGFDAQTGQPLQAHRLPEPIKAFAAHPAAPLVAAAQTQEVVILGTPVGDVAQASVALANEAEASARRLIAAHVNDRQPVGS